MRHKTLIVLAAVVPALLALTVAGLTDRSQWRSHYRTRLDQLADRIGTDAAPAILSGSSYDLESLRAYPFVTGARVLDAKGRTVAIYRRPGQASAGVTVRRPITTAAETLGRVVLKADAPSQGSGALLGLAAALPTGAVLLCLVFLAKPQPKTPAVPVRDAPEEAQVGMLTGTIMSAIPEDVPEPLHLARSLSRKLRQLVIQLDADHRIRCVSGPTEELGYRREELLGKPVREVIESFQPDSDSDRTTGCITASGTRREMTVATVAIRDDQGDPARHILMLHDAEGTSRQIRERLQNLQSLYRGLWDKAYDMIFIVLPDGTVAYANASAARILGYADSDLQGLPIHAMASPDSFGMCRELLLRAFAGETLEPRDVELVTSQGQKLLAEGNFHAYAGPDGEASSVIGIFRDVTEKRRVEQSLKETEERFLHAQKMEAVGLLAGGMAHDFNNILTVMFSYTSLLEEALPPDSALQESVGELHKASRRAASLTRQLLLFSRKQYTTREKVSLNGLIEDLSGMASRLVGERVEMTTRLEATDDAVRADQGQLEQVLMNLIVNARDAMPGGGKIRLQTRTVSIDGQASLEPGTYVEIQVADSGTGIEPEVAARIFEPYFTTKSRGEGTGLGLSTAYGIVCGLGGDIKVDSQPGQGTTFRILLPAQASAQAPTPRRQAKLTPVPTDGTILLVEDDEAVRLSAARILSKRGYKVIWASDGEQGRKALDQLGTEVDLLITDLVLPGPSGLDLARQFLGFRQDGKVLCISGYPDVNIGSDGLPGSCSFLPKPFNASQLCERVSSLLPTGRKTA